jgi:hypothetical protein
VSALSDEELLVLLSLALAIWLAAQRRRNNAEMFGFEVTIE